MSNNEVPCHVGIIMDGNGRWAKARGKNRSAGHLEGLSAAKRITKAAVDLGIKYLSLYAFSTENWKRTEEEVSFLMILIKKHLKSEFNFYRKNEIRVVHSGDINGLPADIQQELHQVAMDTADFHKLTVNLAINYGGRDEIIRAVQKLNNDNKEVNTENVSSYMDCPEIPDADLIIRTAGEKRLSNFLLWRSAYSEFYFSDKLWPDWEAEDLITAIKEYQCRERRYGGIKS
ncbi:polyprenyl diphosphate synthase [Spirochaeta cellobiosiphila]|uniref:polyprenyl diphosphate synthase n=1 Tax=Spirochaeta cellobiosiphila TaxID=504483 RepID=UPI000420354E|nr:polyprenyl diphosphate synthase [Spirochaeta cellobiosiphila]